MRQITYLRRSWWTMLWRTGVLLGLATAWGCEGGRSVTPERPDTGPDQVLRNFERTESRVGRMQLVLDASRGDVYDREKRVELVTMRVDFYSREGDHLSHLTADSGHVDTRTENMEAIGNVHVTGEDGAVLTTTRLAWFDQPGEIRTDDYVRIRRGTDEVRGRGFAGEPSLKTFRLLERVEGEVSGEEIRREDERGPGSAK